MTIRRFRSCALYRFFAGFRYPRRNPGRAPCRILSGLTIGNFETQAAAAFLKRIAAHVGKGGGLLIGADRKKDEAVLHGAYNDGTGVTADFNLNLLKRINNELGGDFDLSAFTHVPTILKMVASKCS